MTEVLLARIGVGTDVALDLGEELLLERKILQHRLDHVIGFAHGLAKIGAGVHVFDRAFVFAKIAQIGGNARLGRVEILRERVGDGHVMAGEREHLRDAVAHEAGADDSDFCVAHPTISITFSRTRCSTKWCIADPGPFQTQRA